MNKIYWNNYYSKQKQVRQHSLFAQYIAENYLGDEKSSLIELGCGNGRDSIYFGKKGLNVVAIDQSEKSIDFLQNKFSEVKNLEFKSGDFTDLKNEKIYDIVYSRFTLHSINSFEQNRVLNWCYNQLNKSGLLCIEVRGKKNELYKKGKKVTDEKDAYIHDNHYRRFLEFDTLCNELKELGFTIEYSKESKGFAPFNNTDDTFIRIIAKK